MKWIQYTLRAASRPAIKSPVRTALVMTAVLLAMPLLWAHHGLAEFDTTRTVKKDGTVTGIDWINPHAFIYADIKNEQGKVQNWKLELGSLGMLTKYGGWTQNTVKRGDRIDKNTVGKSK